MRLNQNIGMLLLAIWLILISLLPLLGIGFVGLGAILDLLAIAAGILVMLAPTGRSRRWGSMGLNRNAGMLLLGIWLILTGLLPLLGLGIRGIDPILALLAIAAGILVLLEPTRISRSGGLGSLALTRSAAMVVLGIWLILTGLLALMVITFPAAGIVLELLALAAGILILLRR
jgi:ABC-type thiamin/hydroxymethylpyrimidine transport system permease subunit